MNNIYDEALYLQLASNPGPVVAMFCDMIKTIRAELEAERGREGWGTDDITSHPVFVLMADKLQSMAGYGQRYSDAYDEAIKWASPETLQLLGIPARTRD